MGFIRDSLSNAVSFVREEIMPIRGELIKAGILSPLEPRGYEPKSNLSDPFSYSFMGYGYKERFSALDYSKLRAISYADPIIAAIIQTRMNQVAAFAVPQANKYKIGFKIQMRDKDKNASKVGRSKAKEIEQFILACGFPESFDDTVERRKRDSFEMFLRKIVRDSLTFDQLNFEVVPRNNGQPAEFIAVDAGTIRLTADKRDILDATYGTQSKADPLILADMMVRAPNAQDHQAKHPRLCQVIRGQIVTTYDEWEMAYGIRNPRTDILANGYGFSEIEQLISTITAHINAETYNKRFFSAGSSIKGVLAFEGQVPPDQLESFRRQWHCISSESLVFTSDGVIPIIDLVGKEFSVWDGEEFSKAKAFETEICQRIRTELSSGLSIITSPDHKFMVVDDDGEIVFKKQRELVVGDCLATNDKALESGGKIEIRLDRSSGKGSLPATVSIDENMAEVLGWLLCDGTLSFDSSRGKISTASWYCHHEREVFIRDKMERALTDAGFAPRLMTPKTRIDKVVLNLSSQPFINMCLELGFTGSNLGKHFPEKVLSWPTDLRRAFARAMLSADGGLKRKDSDDSNAHGITFTKKHPSVCRGLVLLLNSLGIASIERGCRVFIQDREKFLADVGFLQGYKNDFSIDDRQNRKWDILPDRIAFRLAFECKESDAYNDLDKNDRLAVCAILRGTRSISRSVARRLFGDVEELRYRYNCVSEIEDLEECEQMYDVEVFNDKHYFVANGIVVHNSQVTGLSNAWRTPILSLSKDTKLNWVSLHSSNRDMEWGKYMEYLIKSICGVFQIDPIEIGFDISRNPSGAGSGLGLGGGFAIERIQFSQDKGLLPILRHIAHLINDYVVWRLDPDFEFTFVGHDQYDEKDDVDIEQKAGQVYKTVNEIRAEHDLPKLPDAEDIKSPGDVVLSPTFMQAMTAMSQQGQQGMMPGGQPGIPGGAPGASGPDDQQAEPDYQNMSTDDLQKELAKLQGGGGDDKGKPQPGQPDQGGAGGVAAGRAQ